MAKKSAKEAGFFVDGIFQIVYNLIINFRRFAMKYLKDFVNRVKSENLGVKNVCVRQKGELLESYDFVEPKRIQTFSASKTFTAMAAGIAIGEGLFKITDKMVDILEDELPEELPQGFEEITVWNLLTMTTGHSECPIFKMQGEMREKGIKGAHFTDFWQDAFLNMPLTYSPHDKKFAYNNGASYMLSKIVGKKSGRNLRDYLTPRLFEPLKIQNPQWDTDSFGNSLGAIGLYLTAEELSKAGEVLLNCGEYEGKQLIPSGFVLDMTKKQVETDGHDSEMRCGYGYQVWMCTYPGAYRMDGMFAQFCVVVPDYKAVVAITSHEEKRGYDILRLVWDEILPSLEK